MVRLHVFLVERTKFGLLEVLREFSGGTRLISDTGPRNAAFGVGDGDKKIRRCLTIGRFIAHVDEILPGTVGGTEVGHTTFIDDTDFIKEAIEILAGLIDRDDGCIPVNVSRNAEGSSEFQSRRGIKTTRGAKYTYKPTMTRLGLFIRSLVPGVDAATHGHCFRDRDTLLLSTTDTTDGVVSNIRIERVPQTQNGGGQGSHEVCVLSTGLGDSGLGCTCCSGEGEGLSDGEGGEMDIVLGAILHVATIVLSDFLRRQGIVMDIAINVVVLAALVGQILEEGATSRSRTPQDHWCQNELLTYKSSRITHVAFPLDGQLPRIH